jgi:hypothetical protein
MKTETSHLANPHLDEIAENWKTAHIARFANPVFEPASLSRRGGDEPALTCYYETPIGRCYANSISLETGKVFRFA